MTKSENRPIYFGDLISTNCVLRRASEELFSLVFLALSTWRVVKGSMASEGNSWSSVHSEDLPKGLSDREQGETSSNRNPSVLGLSKGVGV